MPLFRIAEGRLRQISLTQAKKERDIQRLIEENLWEALEVHFIESEYRTTSGGRMDTLGVDGNGAPTIIEYKRDQNDNVINQGLSYLRWLTTQKVEVF
jgi:RecB family endonuclease NucS